MRGVDPMSMDPILVDVLWQRLLNVVEEEARTLMRTAFTNILSDAGDLSAGVFDLDGRMMAQAITGTPGHINSMAIGVKHFLRAYPPQDLQPGDVLIGNDPHLFSGHLNDITVATPVFWRERCVALFASTCHAVDIGGRGETTEARDMYEEGLFIPITKLYAAGQLNRELAKFIDGNIRRPYEVMGDLQAQVTANEVAGERLKDMLAEFDLGDLQALSAEILGRSEAAMRAAIRALPDGVYENQIYADAFEDPVLVKAAVRIEGDSLTVDFAGSAPEHPKGINVVLNYTKAYTTFALLAALCPDAPINDGSFQPITITAPEGCILNARKPAPVALRHLVGHFAPECVLGALHQVAPERVLCEGATSPWAIELMGRGPAEEPVACLLFNTGGSGARATKDGLSTTGFPTGVRSTPVELIEATLPLRIHRKELRPDSGGAGRFRGGLGQVLEFELVSAKPVGLSSHYPRTRHAPAGLAGGQPGAIGRCFHNGQPMLPTGTHTLQPGDRVVFELPGGGGYGPPSDRDPALAAADLRAGYVTL
jgi:N-methylhydantoinase B